MRTTKKPDVIQEEDEYLDFVLGGPGGFSKKHGTVKNGSNKKIQKSSTTKKLRNT